MTLYQRISPTYEVVKYTPKTREILCFCYRNGYVRMVNYGCYLLTNTATGERSVVSQGVFEREFREVEG